ncbi:hypothetical protein B7486_72775, partial [cyanobacterium TDX16]
MGAVGRPSSTEALLAAGADPNEVAQVDGRSVLLSSGLWRLPLSTGVPEPLTHGRGDSTALHAAALVGDADGVRLLLEAGADPNAIAYDAFTPLHFAHRPRTRTRRRHRPTPPRRRSRPRPR